MAPFIKYLVFNCFHILLYVVIDYLFPLPYHVLLCECTINSSTLLLIGIWVVSSLGVFPVVLLFLYNLIFGCSFFAVAEVSLVYNTVLSKGKEKEG